jgi:N6-adenosine-specific RNA methylase IME4
MFTELNPPYTTLVVDPPWHYDVVNPPNPGLVQGHTGAAEASGLAYSSLSLDEIRGLPIDGLAAPDARLFLWTTNRYLRHAWSVVESWGFTPQDRVLVWCKPPMGTLNVTTEFVLIGRKGRPPRLPWHSTTWFAWPRPHHAHSQKPDAFLDLVEAWCPGPYVELFCRRPRLGWDSWGHGYETAAAGSATPKSCRVCDRPVHKVNNQWWHQGLGHSSAIHAVEVKMSCTP